MRAKLGLCSADPGDGELARDLLDVLQAQQVDFTSGFRALSAVATGDAEVTHAAVRRRRRPSTPGPRVGARRLDAERRPVAAVAAEMDRINPVYIPRNHLVEEALTAATAGDLSVYESLLDVVTHPYEARSGWERYAQPAPPSSERYRTFCGT